MQKIKNDLNKEIVQCQNKNISINEALTLIKIYIERAIKSGGNKDKGNLIRTQLLIKLIHEAIKAEFINKKVNSNYISPKQGESSGEIKLAGLLKTKDQDITIKPKNGKPCNEKINTPGLLNGYNDKFGSSFTEKLLSVNVRSQLSSLAKNFDTLYERTFAESFNLHKRCPNMVLGECYLIPVKEYDVKSAINKKVSFSQLKDIQKHIEKYLIAFDALNNRINTNDDYYKYEKVCLLVVDFSQNPPKLYSKDSELVKDNLLDKNHKGSIDNLNFNSFVADLLNCYSKRFGKSQFK